MDFGQHGGSRPRGAALRAARAETDRRGEALALRRIFRVHWERGDVQVADGATARAVGFYNSYIYMTVITVITQKWEN